MAVNAGADQTNLKAYDDTTVTATGGTGNHTWTLLSGLPVVIPAGTAAARTFPAPAAVAGGSTILRVTDAAPSVDDVALTTLPHPEWVIREAPPLTYVEEVLLDSPLLYWRLGESSGAVAEDSSGNGRDGTLHGTPTLGVAGLVAGDADTAIDFDGTDDDVAIAAASWMDVTTALTVECLVKIPATSNTRTITGRHRPGVSTDRFALVSAAGNAQAVYRLDAGGATTAQIDGPALDDDTPHHVATTWDGTTVRLYVDGVEEDSAAFSGTMTATTMHFRAGSAGLFSSLSSAQLFLDGTIDEVAYYDTCLSAARITARVTAAGL